MDWRRAGRRRGLVAGFVLHDPRLETRDLQAKANDLTREKVEKLHVDLLRSMEVLHSISSLYAADGEIERGQFHDFVRQACCGSRKSSALLEPLRAGSRAVPF